MRALRKSAALIASLTTFFGGPAFAADATPPLKTPCSLAFSSKGAQAAAAYMKFVETGIQLSALGVETVSELLASARKGVVPPLFQNQQFNGRLSGMKSGVNLLLNSGDLQADLLMALLQDRLEKLKADMDEQTSVVESTRDLFLLSEQDTWVDSSPSENRQFYPLRDGRMRVVFRNPRNRADTLIQNPFDRNDRRRPLPSPELSEDETSAAKLLITRDDEEVWVYDRGDSDSGKIELHYPQRQKIYAIADSTAKDIIKSSAVIESQKDIFVYTLNFVPQPAGRPSFTHLTLTSIHNPEKTYAFTFPSDETYSLFTPFSIVEVSPERKILHFWASVPNQNHQLFSLEFTAENPKLVKSPIQFSPNGSETVFISKSGLRIANVEVVGGAGGSVALTVRSAETLARIDSVFLPDAPLYKSAFRDVDQKIYAVFLRSMPNSQYQLTLVDLENLQSQERIILPRGEASHVQSVEVFRDVRGYRVASLHIEDKNRARHLVLVRLDSQIDVRSSLPIAKGAKARYLRMGSDEQVFLSPKEADERPISYRLYTPPPQSEVAP